MTLQEYRVFGPPGTGKTTYISRQIANAVEKHGSKNVLVASFTKAAAVELIRRDLPVEPGRVGTLHAICYHALSSPPIVYEPQYMEEWGNRYPYLKLSSIGAENNDDLQNVSTFSQPGDETFAKYARLRALRLDPEIWPDSVRQFHEAWTKFKREQRVIDFEDMIEICLKDYTYAPGKPTVGFFDEVQDFSALELSLVRKWGAHMDHVVLAGDDDQCSIRGTRVLTNLGYKQVEDLDPEIHRLVCYDRQDGTLCGFKKGYSFNIQSNQFHGTVATVQAAARRTTCTLNHKWYVKWTSKAKTDTHVVYLMRRGSKFRVGWCKLFRNDGTFHLGVRARLEGADEAWILKTTNSRSEASIYESYVATKYGLPLIPFTANNGSNHYTQDNIDLFFEMLNEFEMIARACQCLTDHGRHIGYSLWSKKRAFEQQGGCSIMLVETYNLESGLMAVPVAETGKNYTWEPITVSWREYDGEIYSLDVERHHTYVADGIVTHNSIYHFKGATPDAFLYPALPPENIHVLAQSYRLPREVKKTCDNWISRVGKRQEKNYRPRDFDGAVRRLDVSYMAPEGLLDEIERLISDRRTIMILASCGYMLSPIIAALRDRGIPFHNPYRKIRFDWNPLARRGNSKCSPAERLIAYLRTDPALGARLWTGEELHQWALALKSSETLFRGAKQEFAKLAGSDELVTCELLDTLFKKPAFDHIFNGDLNWYRDHLTANYSKVMEFPIEIVKHRGVSALIDRPQVIVGTIHSVKGGEADVVVLFPDISQAADQSWQTRGDAHDSIVRTFYVGMTRAREELILCSPSSHRTIEL